MKLQLGSTSIEIKRLDKHTLLIDGIEHRVDSHELDSGVWSLIVDGRPATISVSKDGTKYSVTHGHHAYTLRFESEEEPGQSKGVSAGLKEAIAAKMPGKILSLSVVAGQAVEAQQRLLVLEAMKMENEILAPFSGQITDIAVNVGDIVVAGQTLLTLSS